MKKPKRNELIVALIISVVLVGASVYANAATRHPLPFAGFTSQGDASKGHRLSRPAQ